MPSFKKIYPAVFGLVLTAYTVYSVLDTFVLTKAYRTAEVNNSFVFITQPVNTAAQEVKPSDNVSEQTSSDSAPVTSVSEPASGDVTSVSAFTSVSGVTGSSKTSSVMTVPTGKHAVVIQDNSGSIENNDQNDNNGTSENVTQAPATEVPKETQPPETEAPPPPPPLDYIPENDGRIYSDDNIRVGLKQYREYDTDIYVADVKLSSLAYLKTAFANNTYGRNVVEKTSVIAEQNNAIFAINGDYYGARDDGFVARNGVLYRDYPSDQREALIIKADSTFEIVKETDVSAQELMDNGAYQIFSFGPGLVKNSEISVSENDEVDVHLNSNPRTAIGFIDYNHFILVVSDGRVRGSAGLSLYQLAQFMKDRGATMAYNLDGGGSSSMYFQGEIINKPNSNGRDIEERRLSDIVYIGY